MKKILPFLFVLLHTVTFSQEGAWVYFNDKPNAQTYLSNPLSMLSQRALDRRAAQNIAVDIQDVPIHQNYIDQITAVPGISVMAKSKWMNALHIRGTQSVINGLTTLSFVHHVDFANKTLNTNKNTNTAASGLFNKTLDVQANFPYGASAAQIQMLNGHLLHQQDFTGTGKIIAVMDAGFPGVDTTDPFLRLRTNNQIKGGYNFVNRNANFYTGFQHGTQVLSNMAAYVDNQLVGTAPDASYYLFVTEDINSESPLEESLWVEAAETADSLGVDVINSSLGYNLFTNAAYNHTYQDMDGNTGIFHYQHTQTDRLYWLRPDPCVYQFQELLRDLDTTNGLVVSPTSAGGPVSITLQSTYSNEQHQGSTLSLSFKLWPRN